MCSNWSLCSKQPLRPRFRSPLLMLCPQEGGCRLYNPKEDRWRRVTFRGINSYETHTCLGVSHQRIVLPRLETPRGGPHEIKRGGENKFKENLIKRGTAFAWGHHTRKDLRDLNISYDKNRDYVVVRRVSNCQYLGFCKKGDVHYREITLHMDVRRELQGVYDFVLKGYNLYFLSTLHKFPMAMPRMSEADEKAMYGDKAFSYSFNGIPCFSISELTSQPLESLGSFACTRGQRDAKDLDPGTLDRWLVEVMRLCFFDLGITVPADHSLGIEPNSIYFTRHDRRFNHMKRSTPCINVCVYRTSNAIAMWFLPSRSFVSFLLCYFHSHADTEVFWDVTDFPIRTDRSYLETLRSVLASNGYTGELKIKAYGEKKPDNLGDGVTFLLKREKFSRLSRMLVDIGLWELDTTRLSACTPKNVMVIAENIDEDTDFEKIKRVKLPSASFIWIWKDLLAGKKPMSSEKLSSLRCKAPFERAWAEI
ncbi:LOW QUALITY PROTEIN: hypothetical protein HID58_049685 [Brassica napus]|uniref:Uncharacterized protein n=1 Tax=Brassica napus TaxID=3708 RepID=A0ABQ8B5P5_BRANA|nr:LOW QUALITY PROTEIN: hypothetical protein HID58_049685 [Brassica napus]